MVLHVFKVSSILALVISSTLAVDKCEMINDEGDYPIFDITTHIDGIFRYNTSEAIELLRKLLKEEMSPTLFFATDYTRNILQTLNDTFVKVANLIKDADTTNSVNLKRQIILSLRPIIDFDLTPSTDYELLPAEVLQVVNESLARVVIEWGFLTDCYHFLHHSTPFLAEVNNDLASLRKWKQDVRVGVEDVGASSKRDCHLALSAKILEAHFVVITMNLIAEVELQEYYTIFKEHAALSTSKRNATLLRMTLAPYKDNYNEQFSSYQNLAWEYAAKWQEESKCRVIITTINEYKPSAMLPSTRELREEMTSWNSTSHWVIPLLFDDVLSNLGPSDCLNVKLGQIATKFDALLVDFDVWTKIMSHKENSTSNSYSLICRENDEKHSNLPTPSNIVVLVNLTNCGKKSCKSLKHYLDKLEVNREIRGMSVKSVVVDFADDFEKYQGDLSTNFVLSSSRLTLGCYSRFSSFGFPLSEKNETAKFCPLALSRMTRKSVSIWEFSMNFDHTFDYSTYLRVQGSLRKIFESVLTLRKSYPAYPATEVIIRLVARPGDKPQSQQYPLFCDRTTPVIHAFLEAVSTWAYIHKTRVILKPRLNNITNGSLFINIPAEALISSATSLKGLLYTAASQGGVLKVEGVHISISRDLPTDPKEYASIIANIAQSTKFGVALKDDTSLPQSTTTELIRNASYLVCKHWMSLLRTEAERDLLQEFLDFQLASKDDLFQLFPNLQTILFQGSFDRLGPGREERGSVQADRYLKYMSMLNEYRRAYNISLFVFGFDKDDSLGEADGLVYPQIEAGWWSISNYDDLSLRSVYSEKQSNYFNNPSWRPLLEDDNSLETSLSDPWLIALISVTSIIVVLALVIYIFTLRRKVHFLTDKEVREFFEGASSDDANPSNTNEHGYLYQGLGDGFEIPKSELNPGDRRILGTGNFGLVYEAEVNGCRVAVKVPHDNCGKETFRSMLFEVKILSYLGTHENVIEFVGCYTKEIQNGIIFIVTKLCERGSLQNHLIRELRAQDESTNDSRLEGLVRFSLQIASGMDYIRGKHIVHGDLSTRNVLLDGDLTCKIADFGLSRKVYEYGKYVKENQEPLPWRWMAYESLVDMEFTSQSDVWSYGVTLWEIFSLGATPYPGLSWTVDFSSDLRKGLRLGSPQYAPEAMYEYLKMRTCWNLDSATRPNFKELLEFFQGIRNQQFYSDI